MQIGQQKTTLSFVAIQCSALALACGAFCSPAHAQAAGVLGSPAPQMTPPGVGTPTGNFRSPIVLPETGRSLLAVDAPPSVKTDTTSPEQFDLTPVRLPERGSAFAPLQNLKTGILYYLPAKVYLNAQCENSLRLETNVLQRRKNVRTDAVYRVFPNVTLGYSFNRTTRLAANFFYFRDEYFNNSRLSRNIASIGFRAEKDFLLTQKTTLTTSFLGRELLITHSHSLVDAIPGVTVFRRVGRTGGVYGSVLGQVRWDNLFKRYQEFDQFYSFGGLYRTQNWTYIWDNTLIDNFGIAKLRGNVASNHQIIMTLEADRKVSSRLPLVAFIRAQPIFNMGQDKRQGFAGFNFRLFGGIRAEISKPAIFPVKLRSG